MKASHPTSNEGHYRFHAAHRAGPFLITLKSYSQAFAQGWHEHELGSIDFVLSGGGVGTYAKTEIVSQGGQVEYFAGGVRHRFHSAPSGIRTLHITFPGELPASLGIDPDLLASDLPASSAIGPATAILTEILNAPAPDLLLLESLAMRMLEELAGPARSTACNARWIDDVRELIIESPELATSLAAIASITGLHPSHVSRQFRAAQGITVGEFGRRVRILRAAKRLASGRAESIARLASEHGFCDQAHLTNAFTKLVGCSPKVFACRLGQLPKA